MAALPFSRASAPLNALLAAFGLAAVAALTSRGLEAGPKMGFELLLVGIWLVFCLQLASTLFGRPTRDRVPALVVDLAAVIIPVAAFLLASQRDRSLYCAIWLIKPMRDSAFFRLLGRVIANEARNLFGVTAIFGIVLFAASFAAYLLERDVQPDRFGSIPLAMWWAVVTLSTTGYGDEIPMTFAGRVLAGLVMMSGIGIFALWAGILASAFYEETRRQDFVRKWQLVAAVPLFKQLGSGSMVEIVRALRPRIIPAGSAICRKGESGDQMYFIAEGSVRVETPEPVVLGPGAFFGEMALVTGAPRSATVSAITEVSLLSLYAVDFQILSGSNPDIAEMIRKTALERKGASQ